MIFQHLHGQHIWIVIPNVLMRVIHTYIYGVDRGRMFLTRVSALFRTRHARVPELTLPKA